MNSVPIHTLKLHLADTNEDGVKYVNLYSRGTLCEYSKSDTVLTSLDIQQPLTSSCVLKVFYSCMPKYKHYLVLSEKALIVVRKVNNELKIQERLSDVTKVLVCDYFTLGYPQTVIWFEGDSQPRVTDFCSTHIKKDAVFPAPETSNSLNRAMISQYQKAQTQINITKKLLQEKRRLALVTMRDYMMNVRDESQAEGTKPVQESSVSSVNPDLVLIEDPWLRVHNNRYVIGFDMKSAHNEPIFGFSYILLNQENLMTETILFVEKLSKKGGDICTAYTRADTLEESKCCTLVAVIDEPCLTESTIKLSGILCFSLKDEKYSRQAYVQPVTVNFNDLISGRFNVNDLSIKEDMLTVLAVSDRYYLKVTGERLNLDYILQKKLSFSYLDSSYYVMKTCSLSYVVIQLIDDKHIRIHCQGPQKLLIVVHLLKEHFSEDNQLKLSNDEESLNSILDSLSNELTFLKDSLKEKFPPSSLPSSDNLSISIEPEEWNKIQKKYAKLQAETDSKMFSLMPIDE